MPSPVLASSLSDWIPTLRLIPPLHEDFVVYGGKDIHRRVLAWAQAARFALVQGVPACAHGFYMMRCPGNCSSLRALDHVELWVACGDKHSSPFLLAHPYLKAPEQDHALIAYANAHGLTIDNGLPADHWYSQSAPPVRLQSASQIVPFPIEIVLAATLALSPIRWRCQKFGYCQRNVDHKGECSTIEDEREALEYFQPTVHAGHQQLGA